MKSNMVPIFVATALLAGCAASPGGVAAAGRTSEPTAMNIVYWSDFACPYCYIGVTRMEKAIAAVAPAGGISLEMRAFELDPSAPVACEGDTTTRFARKYGLSAEGAAARIGEISSLGRAEGIDFRYATTRYTSTFDAHRLAAWARSLGDAAKARGLETALYAAYFTENRELSGRATLLAAAEKAGLDRAAAETVLADGESFASDVRADEREAARLGVHGVPFFLVAGRYAIPGAMPQDALEAALRRALAEAAAPAGAAGEGEASSCGPDGCHWEPRK